MAFAAAVVRERLWFLSMLLRAARGAGRRRRAGAAGADRRRPTTTTSSGRPRTDSAQPISNALYASLGIVPRMPLLNLIGTPTPADAFGALPSGGVRRSPFDADVAGRRTTGGSPTTVDALDREPLGVAHPVDHRYLRQRGPARLALPRPRRRPARRTATPARPAASGRSPAATRPSSRRSSATCTTAVTPRGAFAMWLPGDRRPGDRRCSPGRLPARAVPGPAVLGPPVRRLHALPADLSRTALDPPGPDHRPGVAGPPVPFAASMAGGSLGADVAPAAVPADGVEPNRHRWRPSIAIRFRPRSRL